MVNPRQEKLKMRDQVIEALNRDLSADQNVLISSLKLESGFGTKVVTEILKDMENVGLIKIDNGVITLTKKPAKPGAL